MDAKELHDALGPLASLYEDENTREIIVDGPDKVYVFSEGELVDETKVRFDSSEEIRSIIDSVLHLGGVELDEQDNTIAEIRLTDGARFNAAIPPTAVNGPCLTIRKFPARKLTWENLIKWKSLTTEIHEFMQATMQAGKNVLVSGGPASGKTTLANMFA
ncbi:MAG: CpaF family protein, partial [Anaerolineales bacterium]|nr:CpaF family protein [Anaerolineales bacterium]